MTRVDASDYREFAARLKQAPKEIQREIRADLRKVSKELGQEVLEAGAEQMPQRGGLAEWILARGRVGVSITGIRMELALGMPKKSLIELLDSKAFVRHPVFGHRDRWKDNPVPGRTWSDDFAKRGEEMAVKLQPAFERAVGRLAQT